MNFEKGVTPVDSLARLGSLVSYHRTQQVRPTIVRPSQARFVSRLLNRRAASPFIQAHRAAPLEYCCRRGLCRGGDSGRLCGRVVTLVRCCFLSDVSVAYVCFLELLVLEPYAFVVVSRVDKEWLPTSLWYGTQLQLQLPRKRVVPIRSSMWVR